MYRMSGKCLSFPNENNSKIILNVTEHGWATKKNFHSILPKTTLNLTNKNMRSASCTRKLL